MKLDARRVAGFLRDPGACRVVLLYGDDTGLIRERAEALVRGVVGARDDPFRVVELAREQIGQLADEACSLSLTGGRRVVRVREAGEGATEPVKSVLAGKGPALVVLEGAALAPRSRLRALVEAAPDAAAIGCYPEEGRALDETIRAALTEAGVTAEPEALHWLAGRLGADRAATRQELAKLALYAGPGGGSISRRPPPASAISPGCRWTTRCSPPLPETCRPPIARWNWRWRKARRRWACCAPRWGTCSGCIGRGWRWTPG